jgi:hypothetical protein
MYDAGYWRDEAEKLRNYADRATEPRRCAELLDLAIVCDEVAETIEERAPGG